MISSMPARALSSATSTGSDHRSRLGISTEGPVLVVTDLCVMNPHRDTKELTVTSIHPGVTREQIKANTGWEVHFAEPFEQTPPPNKQELAVLRDLQARTARAG